MRVDEFDYCLPQELIAQKPLERRDESRLMVLDRATGRTEHRRFRDIKEYLRPGDILVVNDTRVIPARLKGVRQTGGKIEVLLLKDLGGDDWECLVKPGHKVRPGDVFTVPGGRSAEKDTVLKGTVKARTAYGGRVIHWEYQGRWEDALEKVGQVPLPPYIKSPIADPSRYQTVYARVPGSAAAPTAGLHFTPELLAEIRDMGVLIESVTLNVGLGTFRPVKEETVEAHVMHEEYFEISEETARVINEARESGGRLFAVGTTVVRSLESSSTEDGKVLPFRGETRLFIYPPYRFKAVDHMVTNFHLPRSTLLMLVAAFAGKDNILRAYREAVDLRYRFFSFGDAMLIL
ncbi:MAG TPA: tRNA preQ1(34) S-adenosylmethionine ribosyltransferase-isomerase QueA [Firmicutes bacterium]|nr:tRNA preQ1(34) S-adenosylmethionine ribosyltransferase-isomerase QueA [Candidatus Fermentithermobacillaceae bacterium]